MIQDLHSHTYYSFCGKDSPETIVEAAIAVGFDGHRVEDYLPERIAFYCKRLTELGIRMAFED